MLYLSCGKVEIPMPFVSSMSWTRTARTTKKTGGYERSLGYETTEISVRAVFNFAISEALGIDANSLYHRLASLVTDCVDEPSRLIVGDFEPVPSLEFALTSCNRTSVYDMQFDPSLELDLVFSGVRCVKEMARKDVLTDATTSGQLPTVSLSRNGKTLDIRDSFSIHRLIIRESSVEIGFTVRDDMTVINRDGFLTDLCDGTAKVLVQGLEYAIISANIEANNVEITGSFWPVQSQKPLMETYTGTNLKSVLKELAERGGIKADIRINGDISYYLNNTSPMESIQMLVESAGALSIWREGKLLIVDVPGMIPQGIELDARVDASNDASEKITSCVWSDGLTSNMAGNTDGQGIAVSSAYSGENRSNQCLAKAKFLQNSLVVECPISLGVEQGSAVTVQVADSMVSGLVTAFEADYISWNATYYISYI